VKQVLVDDGERPGLPTNDRTRLVELARGLRAAAGERDPEAQYLAIRYTERLAEIGALGSVGSVGDSYDCETPARRPAA
jgi:putative transposase